MRLIFGLVLIVGIGLAGFATYMAKNYIDQYRQQLAEERAQRGPAIETVNVIVARHDLKYGEELTKDAVAMVPIPRTRCPKACSPRPSRSFPKMPAARARCCAACRRAR